MACSNPIISISIIGPYSINGKYSIEFITKIFLLFQAVKIQSLDIFFTPPICTASIPSLLHSNAILSKLYLILTKLNKTPELSSF